MFRSEDSQHVGGDDFDDFDGFSSMPLPGVSKAPAARAGLIVR